MANTYLTPLIVTREAARRTLNHLVFAAYTDRSWSKQWKGKWDAKIGASAAIRIPTKYVGGAGPALDIEDSVETSVPLTIGFYRNVHLNFDSSAFSLDIDDFSERYLASACAQLANTMDSDVASLYKTVFNVVGTPGTVPTSTDTYLGVSTLLDNNAAPMIDEERVMITSSLMQQKIWPALAGLFNDQATISRQYTLGHLMTGREALGLTWQKAQNTPVATIGVYSGTPVVNGANQVGTSIITNGWTAGSILNQGDIIYFANVFAVNPMSRVTTTALAGFVVTATTTADGSGNMTIPVNQALSTVGAYQTVTNSPANGAAVTVYGASGQVTTQGMAFHREAFALVSIPLPEPGGVDMVKTVTDEMSGISIRIIRAYDPQTDGLVTRLDTLYGLGPIRNEWACRVAA